jgi:hypothetical protein
MAQAVIAIRDSAQQTLTGLVSRNNAMRHACQDRSGFVPEQE